MKEEFISALRRRLASTTVGPSAVRGMGPKGTVFAARDFLANIDVKKFNNKTEREFILSLNKTTQLFVKKMPDGAKHWGTARKLLNLFLRAVVYNRFLCEKYNLYHIEPWLEVPLDSNVAEGLRSELTGETLPKWKTVIGLDKKTSHIYQTFASEIARAKGENRVHLDLIYWRRDFVTAKSRK